MSFVLPAIEGGVSLFNWLLNKHAANTATNAQNTAIGSAENGIYQDRSNVIAGNQGAVSDVRNNNLPASIVGKDAIFRLQDMIDNPVKPEGFSQLAGLTEGTNPADVSAEVLKDPAFKFNFDQAIQGIKRAAAAPGGSGLRSGQMLQDITKFATDYGSNEYAKAQARLRQAQQDRISNLTSLVGIDQKNINDQFSHLSDVSKIGQTADINTNAATQNAQNNITDFTGRTGQQLVDLTTAGGNVNAANAVAGANNTSSFISNIAGDVGNLIKLSQLRDQNGQTRTTGFSNGGNPAGV